MSVNKKNDSDESDFGMQSELVKDLRLWNFTFNEPKNFTSC